MKGWLIICGLLLSVVAAAGKKEDQTVFRSAEDPEMIAAIKEAQATLDGFLRVAAKPPEGASGFRVKVMVKDAERTEHLWVIPFTQEPTGFSGIVANDATYVRNVAYGQKISFGRSDITDWGYVLNGKQKGSFTICVLFKTMPAAEVEQYRNDHGFQC